MQTCLILVPDNLEPNLYHFSPSLSKPLTSDSKVAGNIFILRAVASASWKPWLLSQARQTRLDSQSVYHCGLYHRIPRGSIGWACARGPSALENMPNYLVVLPCCFSRWKKTTFCLFLFYQMLFFHSSRTPVPLPTRRCIIQIHRPPFAAVFYSPPPPLYMPS